LATYVGLGGTPYSHRVQEWRRTPGMGRYAHPERERRFLVGDDFPAAHQTWLIEDRYIDDTSLRLRRVSVDDESVWKLTQKVRADAGDPTSVSITNVYLTAEEYDVFATLPAATLRKVRHVCPVDGTRFVVDVFSGDLAGLRLAEVEVGDLAAPLDLPGWLGEEVTNDDRYSGGRLARMTQAEINALTALTS
jgi:CYTH domain-containing protein